MNKLNAILYFFLLIIILNGCKFKQFFLSDTEIENHYKCSEEKPFYWKSNSSDSALFCACIGEDCQKPILLLIHGSPGAWYGYIKQFDDTDLQKQFTMVSIDRPGFGKSRNTGIQSIVEQANSIGKVLETFSPNRPVYVLGRSYGSPVAVALAAKYPNQIKGLILVSSAVDPNLEKYFSMAFLLKKGSPFRHLLPWPILNAQAEKDRHQNDLKEVLPFYSKINIPVSIIQDKDDKIVYPKNGDFLDSAFAKIPHQYIKLSGNGHLITYHNPQVVRDAILWMKNEAIK
jgi:pimeloyl-ACP methyl ester carboxylesterase